MPLCHRMPRKQRAFHRLPGAVAGAAACVDAYLGAHQGDAAAVQLDEAAPGVQGKFVAGFQHHLVACLDVQLSATFTEPGLPGLDVQGAVYGEVLLAFGVLEAVAVHRVMVVVTDLADAVVLNLQEAVVADLFSAVVKGEQL